MSSQLSPDSETPVPMDTTGPPGLAQLGKRGRSSQDQAEDDQSFQEAEEPVPTELAGAPPSPRRELTLQDIMDEMRKGFAGTNAGMGEMKRDLGKVTHEVREAKDMAAKATTLAHETNEKMTSLEERVAKLEAGNVQPQPQHRQRGVAMGSTPKRDWEYLGGDEGNLCIVGGFRLWADREERQMEWAEIKERLPTELKDEILDTIIPTNPCQIVMVKVRKFQTVEQTRTHMIEWCKKVRNLELKQQAPDENTARTIYAQPSKPFEMRQRDAKTTNLLEAFKLIAGEDKAPKLRADRANGRILFERMLIAERKTGQDAPSPQSSRRSQAPPGKWLTPR